MANINEEKRKRRKHGRNHRRKAGEKYQRNGETSEESREGEEEKPAKVTAAGISQQHANGENEK